VNTGRLPRRLLLLLIAGCACTWGAARLPALSFRQGLIRLDIHESTGRFSLYCMTDPETERYEPLFTSEDPRTSFVAVNIDDRVYRLGEASVFSIELDSRRPTAPAIVFQSPFLVVRQEFLFITTPGSAQVNGVKLAIRVENTGTGTANVGLRVLIDTNLGEGFGAIPFETDLRRVSAEAGIDGAAEDQWWLSRNGRLSLMGSIFAGADQKPDFLHFANWKRLNDMPWKTGYAQGRNFNYPPYSMGDSAVCYYYDPAPLQPRERRIYGIFLAAGETAGLGFRPGSEFDGREEDLNLLRDLLDRLDLFLAGEIEISADDLTVMEQTIARLKSRYSLP
jgi:hypothetical protein